MRYRSLREEQQWEEQKVIIKMISGDHIDYYGQAEMPAMKEIVITIGSWFITWQTEMKDNASPLFDTASCW